MSKQITIVITDEVHQAYQSLAVVSKKPVATLIASRINASLESVEQHIADCQQTISF